MKQRCATLIGIASLCVLQVLFALRFGPGASPVALEGGGSGRAVATVPAHWRAGALVGGRFASYQVADSRGNLADVALMHRRMDPEQFAANLNGWRAQLQLPVLPADKLLAQARSFPSPAGRLLLLDLQGDPGPHAAGYDGRLLIALFERSSGLWQFTLRGNPDVVGAQLEAFLQWSVERMPALADDPETAVVFAGRASLARLGAGDLRPWHDSSLTSGIRWRLPPGWSAAESAEGLFARLLIGDAASGGAEVRIWGLATVQEPTLGMINDWRSALALETPGPMEPAPIPSRVWIGGRSFRMLELSGPFTRSLTAWFQEGSRTWFAQLQSSAEAFSRHAPEFGAFLESVEWEGEGRTD